MSNQSLKKMSGYVVVDGAASLYFETIDGGTDNRRWVTLLNGHTRPLTDFRSLAAALAASGVGVLLIDHRGAGQTTFEGDFTLDDMVADVVRVWDHLGIAGSAVIGISMGGVVALHVAAAAAARVRVSHLVLVSTAVVHTELLSSDDPWPQSASEIAVRLRQYVSDEYGQRHGILLQAMAKGMAARGADGSLNRGSAAQRQAIAKFDGQSAAAALKTPTLIIHGTLDKIIPPIAAERLHALIAGSSLRWIDGAGHLLLAEAPKKLYAEIHAFLFAEEL